MNNRLRIYCTGVGGQGTLTATNLLAKTALMNGIPVVAGEVHGMAQRGGVVESVVLLGGWKAPKLAFGEADCMLAFEPLEALRGLPYLAKGGTIVASSDPLPPLSVSLGAKAYPSMQEISQTLNKYADKVYLLPIRTLGKENGSIQSGNTLLLAAACLLNILPFTVESLEKAIQTFLPEKLHASNLASIARAKTALKEQGFLS
ncbi:MAG: indolepyruvate oxidoreductase subunit beta [Desulfovibrio sp.]|nr:indolepyruvate oxidoreductase subunit beta [Desulfovibrio sp.]